MAAVRAELDHSEVYALTPAGDVKELASGSTPLDFAYCIHTEVGHHCTGAKVNGRMVSLKYEIQNGDVIKIITSLSQHPNQGWLSLVNTNRAKTRIRNWLNHAEQARFLERGREICDRELKKFTLSLKRLIKTGHVKIVMKHLGCNSLDDLLRKVGSGKIPFQTMADEFEPPEIKAERAKRQAEQEELESMEKLALKSQHRKRRGRSVIKVDGIDNMLIKISNCCMPMPGDAIGGFITAGRGVSIHKSDCANFLAADTSRYVEVEWVEEEQGVHKTKIQVVAHDRKGLIVSICNVINADDAEIMDMEAHASQATSQAKINMVLGVVDKKHLSAILGKIKQINGVVDARRHS